MMIFREKSIPAVNCKLLLATDPSTKLSEVRPFSSGHFWCGRDAQLAIRGSKNEAKIEQKWAFLQIFLLSSQRLVLKCRKMKFNNVGGLTFHLRPFWMGPGSHTGHSGAPKQGKKRAKNGLFCFSFYSAVKGKFCNAWEWSLIMSLARPFTLGLFGWVVEASWVL